MNFDVRSYCERLAKADPERWEFVDSPTCWMLWEQPKRKRVAIDCCFSASALWAFIGPLADELGVDPCFYIGQWVGKSQTMTHVEAMFAAVVEKLEQHHEVV